MRLDISQQMKMDQRMMLAPRMIQSMEILQLPILALQERIEQELLSNPTLELEEPNLDEDAASETQVSDEEIPYSERTLTLNEDKNKSEDFARLEEQDYDYADYMNRADYVRRTNDDGEPDRKLEAMQNTAAPAQTLNEYLHDQWLLVECEPVINRIGKAIIDLINDDGYLSINLNDIRDFVQESVTDDQLEEALGLVQTLDPTGVGARDLTECMLMQLQEHEGEDINLARDLILRHLKDIEGNRYPLIVKKSGYSIEEILRGVKIISRLDPRPGLQYGTPNINYIIPDIIVEYDEDNDLYTAHLADETVPTLRINSDYAGMARNRQIDTKTRDFLKNNIQSARWLIESIQQRKQTLLNVVQQVLFTQREFFDKGAQALKPLPMVEVAEKLGIHVTTVSRAVSGKYMQTPTGIYPLKFFFSGGTENASGDAVSWDAIKAKLQEIVDNEDKKKPFSDDELVEELKKNGLEVARRTVAKYRNVLKIPTARQRKQFI